VSGGLGRGKGKIDFSLDYIRFTWFFIADVQITLLLGGISLVFTTGEHRCTQMFIGVFCGEFEDWFFTADGSRCTQMNADVLYSFLLGGISWFFPQMYVDAAGLSSGMEV